MNYRLPKFLVIHLSLYLFVVINLPVISCCSYSHSILFYLSFFRLVWIKDVYHHISPGTPLVLVGTKRDLKARRRFTEEEIRSLAKQIGVRYVETSSRLDLGVDDAFGTLAQMIYKKRLIVLAQKRMEMENEIARNGATKKKKSNSSCSIM